MIIKAIFILGLMSLLFSIVVIRDQKRHRRLHRYHPRQTQKEHPDNNLLDADM